MAEIQRMNAQWFPIWYPMGPKAFVDADGNPSGAAGSIATLTKDISNWPILFTGLRITNVYQLPTTPTEQDIRVYQACKRFVDDEQTVRIELSQQNITTEPTLQVQITGKSGVYWAPFPVPFPMAGGNNITVRVTRVTTYPDLDQQPIQPVVHAAVLAAVARNDEQTVPVRRVFPPQSG